MDLGRSATVVTLSGACSVKILVWAYSRVSYVWMTVGDDDSEETSLLWQTKCVSPKRFWQAILVRILANYFKGKLFAVPLTEKENQFSLILQGNLAQRETVDTVVRSSSVVS